MSSIILGVSALVAINAFNDALVKDVDAQAATLLGSDLELEANGPIPSIVLDSLKPMIAESSTLQELLSMAYFPKPDKSQFVRIIAMQGDFPYYGQILATPESGIKSIQNEDGAVLDQALMSELGLQIGDSVRLGEKHFIIVAELIRAFGGAGISGQIAPVVYIGQKFIGATDLIQPGSLIDYTQHFKLKDGIDIDPYVEKNKPFFRENGVRTETIASQKEDMNEAFSSLNSFLNLVALVALLLGCIGVASSTLVYVRRKTKAIAIFRCLGMTGDQAMVVYLTQIVVLGTISVFLGVLLGTIVQWSLPVILADFLPIEVKLGIPWMAMAEGMVIGLTLTTLFALWPLLSVKDVAPIRVLRDHISDRQEKWNRFTILVWLGILFAVTLTLCYLTWSWQTGLVLVGALSLAFLLLYGLSFFLEKALKNRIPKKISFVWRQGMANLFRPNNQTATLIISLGLGTAVLSTLFIVQGLLLNNIAQMDAGNQPNMVLFGIETNQKDSLRLITEERQMPVIQEVPIVTMRLVEWQGKTKSEWLKDTTRKAENWVIHREARVTYRDTLDESEQLTEGNFVGTVDAGDSIYISLSERYARALAVGIGDELVFNVQGARIKTYVSSLRKISFSSMQARFFIVFPEGVLEEAPQFHVLVTKSPSDKMTSEYRTEVVKRFSNVSVVDLTSILETVSQVLSKISYAVQFMAAFSILTGLLVLISALWLSKYQRLKENALLRTLGASGRQLLAINAMEYAWLGALGAISGLILAIGASYLLARFEFELDFLINWWPLLLILLGVTICTVIIGLWNTRDVLKSSPIQILR